MARLTMRDISHATGFSVFTVSRALSGGDGVSEQSREQILKAAQELGYVVNRAAQELRRANRDTVAVVTAGTSNSYYLDLMAGIQRALDPSAWTVIIGDVAVDGAYDARLEARIVQRLIESRTAGVISALTLQKEHTELLAKWDIPIVFVDSSPEAGYFPSITTNNHDASLMVGQHLAEHGYREWLFLVYPTKWSSRFGRESGLREAARLAGANLVVLETANDAASARAALAKHLDGSATSPHVLIAGNNPLLLGAMGLLRERMIRIPEDMAVVAYDEFAWSALTDPPITVLNEHSEEVGRRAAMMLRGIIEEQEEAQRKGRSSSPRYLPEHQQQVPARLRLRGSCGCPAGSVLDGALVKSA